MRTLKITLKSTLTLLPILALIACDDSSGGDVANSAGGEVAGMTAGIEAGIPAGAMTAGAGAGTNTAGIPAAGTMAAGTEAGTMSAGTEAGTMTAGTEVTPPDCSTATVETPCQVSIYSARQVNLVPDLIPVEVEGVVTAIRINDEGNASHIVLQDPAGGAWSAIWIYLNDAETEALPVFTQGETVRLSGQVEDFFGQRQINTVQSIAQLGAGASITPLTVDASSVATNGVDAASMEAVLVKISGAAVEEINPMAGPGDEDPTHEFVVSGGLRIDDYIYNFTLPTVGDQYSSITGVMRLGNADYKLIPRSADDLQR